MVPILVFLVAVFVYPVAQLLWLSLFAKSGVFTTEHYQRLFTAPVYFTVLRNTFEIAGWTTLLCIVGGYPIAYLLATTTDRAPATGSFCGCCCRSGRAFWCAPSPGSCCSDVVAPSTASWRSAGLIEAPLALLFNMTGVMVGMVHALMPLAVLTHAVGDGDHRPQPDAGRLDARRPRWAGVLAHLLSSVAAGRGRGGSPRFHHRARLLHHAGAARQSPPDHDHPGGHPAGRGDVELPVRGRHRHADAGHGPLRLLSLRPRARHDDAGGRRNPRASAAPASRAQWHVLSAPSAAS